MSVLIQREPVLNRYKAITASRLRISAASCSAAAEALNQLATFWSGTRSVFVSLPDVLFTPELLNWQTPQNVMLEIPASVLASDTGQALIDVLVERQIPLCLDGYVSGMELPTSPSFRFLLANAAEQPQLSNPPGIVLAKGLANNEAFDDAINQGYSGATGWFFLHGKTILADKLNSSHAQIVRLLNLVRSNAEIKEIEAALKQDVTLAFKLLRYINSAGFGSSGEVQSFRHAVGMMGYDKLNRWLSLLLVNASRDPVAPALMQTAIIRGRFMELLGAPLFDQAQLDNLFITGAFSILDVLLGTRLEVVLEHLKLPESINAALLDQRGPLAPLLKLALEFEGSPTPSLHTHLAELGLSAEQCNRAQIEALAFADKLQFN